MVRSATKQAKAKDIDIQRLTKKIQRLEKLTDMSNKGMMQQPLIGNQSDDNGSMSGGIIQEESE